jgi:hypothetical protein
VNCFTEAMFEVVNGALDTDDVKFIGEDVFHASQKVLVDNIGVSVTRCESWSYFLLNFIPSGTQKNFSATF